MVRLLTLAFVACSVDHHHLAPAEPPPLIIESAGAGATSDTGGTGDMDNPGGASANGGEANAAGGAPAEMPPAPTAATSWTFDTDADVGDFQPDEGVEQSFSSADADGSGDSGSLVVTNAATGTSDDFVSIGTAVCVPVVAGKTYDVAAEVEIDTGQGNGSGGFEVDFLDGASCDGALLDLTNYLTATTGTWELGEKMPDAPPLARSALLTLVASKRTSDPPFAVHFDDVRFEAP